MSRFGCNRVFFILIPFISLKWTCDISVIAMKFLNGPAILIQLVNMMQIG